MLFKHFLNKKRWLYAGVFIFLFIIFFYTLKIYFLPDSRKTQIDKIVKICQKQMVANTCQVLKDKPNNFSKAPGSTVLIAGVGRVDAQSYERLQAAGEKMCSYIKESCLKNWQGSECQIAQKVWR